MTEFTTPKGTKLPLLLLKGKSYLQAQHRVLWFREDKPDWRIVTEYINIGKDSALAKASILNEKNEVMAVGHKFECAQHFTDFLEKAETGAIGRALALVGFGTQFAIEMEEGERIVDSPNASRTENATAQNSPPGGYYRGAGPITEPQRKRLYAIAIKKGWTSDDVNAYIRGKGLDPLAIPSKLYDSIVAPFEKPKPGVNLDSEPATNQLGEPPPWLNEEERTY